MGCALLYMEWSQCVFAPCFQRHCAILFMKGALLKDPKKILIQQTENVQGGRQIRFTNVRDRSAEESTEFLYSGSY